MTHPTQLERIVSDQIATENSEIHEIDDMSSLQRADSKFDVALQWLDHSVPLDYLRLVPEDIFFLSVNVTWTETRPNKSK